MTTALLLLAAALSASQQTIELPSSAKGPFGAKVTPDGSTLLVPMFGELSPTRRPGSTVTVVNAYADAVVGSIRVGTQPEDVDYTRDGRYAFVTNSGGASVSIIDVFSRTVVATTRVGTPHRTFLFGVTVSPDGSRAVVNSSDGNYDRSEQNVILLDAEPASPTFGQVVDRITISGGFSRTAFRAATGTFVTPRGFADNDYSASPRLTQFTGTSVAAEAVIVPAPGGLHGIEDVAVTPNGRYAYAPVFNFYPDQGSDELFVVDLDASQLVDIIRLGSGDVAQHGVAISPDGLVVVVTNFKAGTVSLVFTPTNTVFRTVAVGAEPNEVAFVPGGGRFYVTNQRSNTLSRVDVASGAALVLELGRRAVVTPDAPDIKEQLDYLLYVVEQDPQSVPSVIQYILQTSRQGSLSIGEPKDLDPPAESLNGISVQPGGVDGGYSQP